jgi:hypothetical protein
MNCERKVIGVWYEGVQWKGNNWCTVIMWQGRFLSCGYYDEDRN